MNYKISGHALIQAQRRGIRRNTIDLILELGDRKVRLPGNAFAVSMSADKAAELVWAGLSASEIERTSGVVAVINGLNGGVMTFEHRMRRFSSRNRELSAIGRMRHQRTGNENS